jgi:hypothetical protein
VTALADAALGRYRVGREDDAAMGNAESMAPAAWWIPSTVHAADLAR